MDRYGQNSRPSGPVSNQRRNFIVKASLAVTGILVGGFLIKTCGSDKKRIPQKPDQSEDQLDLAELERVLNDLKNSDAHLDLGETTLGHTFSTTINNTNILIQKIPGTDIEIPRPDKHEIQTNTPSLSIHQGYPLKMMTFSVSQQGKKVQFGIELPEDMLYGEHFLKGSIDRQDDWIPAVSKEDRPAVQGQVETKQKEILSKVVERQIYLDAATFIQSIAPKIYPIVRQAIEIARTHNKHVEVVLKMPFATQEPVGGIHTSMVGKYEIQTTTGEMMGVDLMSGLPPKVITAKIIFDNNGNISSMDISESVSRPPDGQTTNN